MFDTTTELLPHQNDAVAKLLPSRVNALFAEMGTGKSRIVIELARLRQAKIDRVVWFCPVSLMATIVGEILKHTDCSPEDIYAIDEKTTDATIPLDRRWYVVGIESMRQSARVVFAMRRILDERTFAIVDESTYIKNNRAKRALRITHMTRECRYRAVLTGTPFSAGVTDLFSQMYFLSPKILGYKSWYSFAANHLIYDKVRGSKFKIVRTHDHDYLARRIAPYSYQIRKDECLDLPEKVYETRTIAMSNAQRALYEDAKDWVLNRYKYDDDSLAGVLRLFGILQNICHGFWNKPILDRFGRETGEHEFITVPTTRANALQGVSFNLRPDEKMVVFAPFRHAVDEAIQALAEYYGEDVVQRFDGSITPKQRDANLARWRDTGRFLVATQSSGGHGLTLTEAHHTVFYGNGFKYSERAQAEDRTHRIGQTHKSVYIDFVMYNSIDERIRDALEGRADALQSFKRQIQTYRKAGTKDAIRELITRL